MDQFKKLKQEIKSYNPVALCIEVNDKAFKHPFLLVSTNNMKQKIMLFENGHDLNRFAEISYSKPTKGMVLATFEVDEKHQQEGFGRFLFELATAHADILGCTHLSGSACPTAPIKGISKSAEHIYDEEKFKQETNTLIKIYQKLGCTFASENDSFFEQHWTGGDKIKNASPLIQALAYQIAETYGYTPPAQMQ